MSPRATILLVDDNEDDVELTLMAFAKQGLNAEVQVARDGVEALERLLGRPGQPHEEDAPLPRLVLLDLNMPRLGGIAVLQKIRENPRTRHLPVVVLTSSNEQRDVAESYSHWVNSYVRKPLNFREFEEVSRQIGLYWAHLNICVPPPSGH